MMMNQSSLQISLETEYIRDVENFVNRTIEKLNISEVLRTRITLSVLEAVTNSVLFVRQQKLWQAIQLNILVEPQKIVVNLEEGGRGFCFRDFEELMTPQELLQKVGRGIYSMISLPDELHFFRNGAQVTMVFLREEEKRLN